MEPIAVSEVLFFLFFVNPPGFVIIIGPIHNSIRNIIKFGNRFSSALDIKNNIKWSVLFHNLGVVPWRFHVPPSRDLLSERKPTPGWLLVIGGEFFIIFFSFRDFKDWSRSSHWLRSASQSQRDLFSSTSATKFFVVVGTVRLPLFLVFNRRALVCEEPGGRSGRAQFSFSFPLSIFPLAWKLPKPNKPVYCYYSFILSKFLLGFKCTINQFFLFVRINLPYVF